MKVLHVFLFTLFSVLAYSQEQKSNYLPSDIEKAKQKGEIILFDQNPMNLGEISVGAKKTFNLKFLNISKETIEIDFFDLCVCSNLEYEEGMKIEPGKEAIFPVTFDSSKVEPGDEEINIDFQLKNIDPRVDLPYFYSFTYTFEFK